VKLLFDQNLSRKLAARLADVFPGSSHVALETECGAQDVDIWQYAGSHGFTIISKDTDFDNLALLFGKPPKAIGIRLGNCSTQAVEILLRSSVDQIVTFIENEDETLLKLP
jgi:predicted nuclease of predicted toxin-antitoxin system